MPYCFLYTHPYVGGGGMANWQTPRLAIKLCLISPWSNRPVAQIPKCTSPISHNAPFCSRNVHMCAHFCYETVQGMGYIVIYVRFIYVDDYNIGTFYYWMCWISLVSHPFIAYTTAKKRVGMIYTRQCCSRSTMLFKHDQSTVFLYIWVPLLHNVAEFDHVYDIFLTILLEMIIYIVIVSLSPFDLCIKMWYSTLRGTLIKDKNAVLSMISWSHRRRLRIVTTKPPSLACSADKSYPRPGTVFCLLLGVSSGCAQPIKGQVTSGGWG